MPTEANSGRSAIAAGHRLAVEAAGAVLAEGGTTVDAAIAGSAVQCVVEMPWCGIGGDGFAMIRDERGNVVALNGSGAAPARIGDAITSGKVPRFGPLSCGVPGLVDAWFEMHRRYGRMPMTEIVAPAVALARDGVCDERLAAAVRRLADIEGGDQLGTLTVVDGAVMQPDLAATIATIAAEGPRVFYAGEIAALITRHIGDRGGVLAAGDLSDHESQWCEPATGTYRGATVYTQPPVSMGVLLLVALRLFERSCPDPMGADEADVIDIMVRIKKLVFDVVLPRLGDPRLVANPDVLDDAYLGTLGTGGGLVPPLTPTGTDTTALAITGRDGMTVSFIHSLFNEFGARELVPGTGIVMNDRLANLAVAPDSPNGLAGGRRPMHTLHSYIVECTDGRVIAGATPGGRGQVQTNMQVLVDIIDRGNDVQAAVDRARWVHGMPRQSPPDNTLYVERALLEHASTLAAYGHKIETLDGGKDDHFGSCTVVAVGDGTLSAAADRRRSAHADIY